MTLRRSVGLYIMDMGHKTEAFAYLTDATGRAVTEVKLRWEGLPVAAEPVDPGTWLLGALEALVEDFDAHCICGIKVHGAAEIVEDQDA